MYIEPTLTTLNALSPLDGRYASRTRSLRPFLSEAGFMSHRVEVEIAWLVALADHCHPELTPFTAHAQKRLQLIVSNFTEADAAAIKDIERTTNHDVKAVEYWLKAQVKDDVELSKAAEFIHFACTSEDINNTSHALMLTRARDQVMVPALREIEQILTKLAHHYADQPLLSRTHG